MSKRLQVLLDEADFVEIQRIASQERLTVAEWVRRALRAARRDSPAADAGRKLQVVRAAFRHDYPTADVQTMLAEIARGYGGGDLG